MTANESTATVQPLMKNELELNSRIHFAFSLGNANFCCPLTFAPFLNVAIVHSEVVRVEPFSIAH